MLRFLGKFFHKESGTKAQSALGFQNLPHLLEQVESERTEKEQAHIQQFVSDALIIVNTELLRLVLRHIKTIVTKYEQAIYRDDYGNIEFNEASKEVDYFISKTVKNGLIAAHLPPHISKDYYTKHLFIFLNDPDFSNEWKELIGQFLSIIDKEGFEDAISSIAIGHMVYLKAEGYSDETLRFIFGDDYQSLRNLACAVINDGFKNTEQSKAAQDAIMTSLITLQDLESLKKWFCERHEHTTTLTDILTGQEFELFCQKRLQELGWNVKTTRATGDFGADLVVDRAGVTIIIQCKYYSQPIGVKAVQEAFSAMTFYNAHKAAVVSNQSYTKAARQMAEKNNVALLHVNELDKLV